MIKAISMMDIEAVRLASASKDPIFEVRISCKHNLGGCGLEEQS